MPILAHHMLPGCVSLAFPSIHLHLCVFFICSLFTSLLLSVFSADPSFYTVISLTFPASLTFFLNSLTSLIFLVLLWTLCGFQCLPYHTQSLLHNLSCCVFSVCVGCHLGIHHSWWRCRFWNSVLQTKSPPVGGNACFISQEKHPRFSCFDSAHLMTDEESVSPNYLNLKTHSINHVKDNA